MSRAAAINAKCKDCIYDQYSPGTWREQVAQCSCPNCPLWPYRPLPYQGRFANAPRDVEKVTREWLKAPLGEAIFRERLANAPDPARVVEGGEP